MYYSITYNFFLHWQLVNVFLKFTVSRQTATVFIRIPRYISKLCLRMLAECIFAIGVLSFDIAIHNKCLQFLENSYLSTYLYRKRSFQTQFSKNCYLYEDCLLFLKGNVIIVFLYCSCLFSNVSLIRFLQKYLDSLVSQYIIAF